MANGLDKLERLFSTKKKSAPSRHTAESSIQDGSAFDSFEVSQALQWQLQAGSSPCQFPPTPFIRPRANAMQPRNELRLSSPQSVARTNSTSSRSQRLSTTFTLDSNSQDTMNDKWRQSTYSTTASFHIPSRTSSLLSRRHEKVPSGLIQLQLPRDTVAADDSTRPSLFPDASVFPLKQEQKCLLDALPIYPAARVETPPPSDQDEFKFPSPPERGRKATTALTQLTPEPSPDMIHRRDSLLSESTSSSAIKRETASAPPSRRITASSVPLLEDDWRDSYVHEPRESASPAKKTVVHEPPVEDFLALTDEDLAEIKIEHPSKPPSRRAPPPPVLPPSARPQSFASAMRSPAPISPALASSAVVAWEAARIAKKFDFDVVYVANFWPSRMNHLHNPRRAATTVTTPTSASPPNSAFSSASSSFSNSFPNSMLSSPVSDHNTTSSTNTTRNCTPRTSFQGAASALPAPPPSDIFASTPPPPPPPPPVTAITDCCPDSGSRVGAGSGAMSGSLLAGYGLETIAAPFRLSARVHKKILRTEGWIEHRKSDAKEDEFARGYARSFYTDSALGPVATTTTTTTATSAAAAAAAVSACTTGRRSSAPDVSAAAHHHHQKDSVARGDGKCRHQASCKGSKKNTNRGIVFVAYRRPCGPGGTVHSSAAELGALEKEAETLVELILDFHKEKRRLETFRDMRRMR